MAPGVPPLHKLFCGIYMPEQPSQFSLWSAFVVASAAKISRMAFCFLLAMIRSINVRTTANRRAHTFARTHMKLCMLQRSLEKYKLEYGEAPPVGDEEQLARHLCFRRRLGLVAAENLLKTNAIGFEDMDRAELLVFWLSDKLTELTEGSPNQFSYFLFEGRQLVDQDGDGHPEYVSFTNDAFVLDNNKVLIESEDGQAFDVDSFEKYRQEKAED